MTDADVRLGALEIASLSAQLADMANQNGDLRRSLAEMAIRLAAVAQELASGTFSPSLESTIPHQDAVQFGDDEQS